MLENFLYLYLYLYCITPSRGLCAGFTLRKQAYSNILKILPPKNENFQIKNSGIFHISAQNIDCGYSLEPPRRGGSNEYPQSMFLSRNKKNNVYPCKPQFYYVKVGFKGVKIIWVCFRDGYGPGIRSTVTRSERGFSDWFAQSGEIKNEKKMLWKQRTQRNRRLGFIKSLHILLCSLRGWLHTHIAPT